MPRCDIIRAGSRSPVREIGTSHGSQRTYHHRRRQDAAIGLADTRRGPNGVRTGGGRIHAPVMQMRVDAISCDADRVYMRTMRDVSPRLIRPPQAVVTWAARPAGKLTGSVEPCRYLLRMCRVPKPDYPCHGARWISPAHGATDATRYNSMRMAKGAGQSASPHGPANPAPMPLLTDMLV